MTLHECLARVRGRKIGQLMICGGNVSLVDNLSLLGLDIDRKYLYLYGYIDIEFINLYLSIYRYLYQYRYGTRGINRLIALHQPINRMSCPKIVT